MNTLIIFDLDGTLADTRADLANAVNLTRNHYGLHNLDWTEIVNYVGEGRTKLIERSFYDKPDVDIPEAIEKFTNFYNDNLTVETELYDGVYEGIKNLAETQYYLAVLSNKPGDMCREITDYFKLDKFLVTTMGGGDVSTTKPNPEGVFEVIKRAEAQGFKRNGENVWMVGDHFTDLQVAQNADIKSIFCNYGFGNRKGLSSSFEVDKFSDIAEIID